VHFTGLQNVRTVLVQHLSYYVQKSLEVRLASLIVIGGVFFCKLKERLKLNSPEAV